MLDKLQSVPKDVCGVYAEFYNSVTHLCGDHA